VLPSSNEGSNICNKVEYLDGSINLTFSTSCTGEFSFCPKNGLSNADFFVGFVGLNNSENYGNMSAFWATPPTLKPLPFIPIIITPSNG
jgi:hypothetical protein